MRLVRAVVVAVPIAILVALYPYGIVVLPVAVAITLVVRFVLERRPLAEGSPAWWGARIAIFVSATAATYVAIALAQGAFGPDGSGIDPFGPGSIGFMAALTGVLVTMVASASATAADPRDRIASDTPE